MSAGDTVDILALECNAPFTNNGQCVNQTTLQNITVYATFQGSVVLVLTHTQAQQLRILAADGTIDLMIRKPGDNIPIPTTSATIVTPQDVASTFGYS
jgi:Flp pilus assembly protein CpaB